MAKKKTSKSTKIKSINKIDKDTVLNKQKNTNSHHHKQQQPEVNLEPNEGTLNDFTESVADFYEENLEPITPEPMAQEVHEEIEPQPEPAPAKQAQPQPQPTPANQQTNELENENIILKKEIIRLQNLVNNLQEENNKLKNNFESNQKQLIDKLKEKQEDAKQQLEARLEKLEADKATEIEERKDAIFAEVATTMIEPFLLFEKTVEQPIQNEIVRNYVEGYKMIIDMFKEAFNNLNIEQIVVNPGDEFNPLFMEAFDTEQNPNFKPNQVTKIISKGFAFKGKVIKFTVVTVNK